MWNKNIILGGGPTGIGIAIGLTEKGNISQDITLIEKSFKLGGLAGSFKSGNDIIDYGPHRLAPTIKEIVHIAKETCGKKISISALLILFLEITFSNIFSNSDKKRTSGIEDCLEQ